MVKLNPFINNRHLSSIWSDLIKLQVTVLIAQGHCLAKNSHGWLIELRYWFNVGLGIYCMQYMQKIILHEVKFNPHKVRLNQTLENSENTETQEFWNFVTFCIFQNFLMFGLAWVESHLTKSHLAQTPKWSQLETRWGLKSRQSKILHSLIF